MERKWSRKQLTVQRKGRLLGEKAGKAALVSVTPNRMCATSLLMGGRGGQLADTSPWSSEGLSLPLLPFLTTLPCP